MGITIRQPGESAAAAKAGTIVGKGKRAEEDRARAEREQARADQMAAQREARNAAMRWEQEKMAMRSQQDFQQELAAKQWDYEKFNRAKAWEIEKMEIASRNDFQQEEKERAEKQAKTAAGLKAIRESDNIFLTPEAKKKAEFDFKFKQKQGFYPPKEAGKEATFAQKKAAAEYIKETELGWRKRNFPKGLGGKELTKVEQQLRAEAESILSENIPTGTISNVEPIYQENKRTGQKRVSYDGGRTWQIL